MSKRAAYLMLIPASVLFLLFALWPMIEVGRLSLYQTNLLRYRWVGLGNYRTIFTSPRFVATFTSSLLYAALIIPGQIISATWIALSIFGLRRRHRSAIQFALFLPTFTAGLIICTAFRWIYHYPGGLANYLLSLVGIKPVLWMADRMQAVLGISLILICSSIGAITTLLVATMLGIPREQFDAAHVDGARCWQIRFRIVLPQIRTTLLILGLIVTRGALMFWETVYMMSPVSTAWNLMYDMYQTGFVDGIYGLAAAKALVLIALVSALGLAQRRLA